MLQRWKDLGTWFSFKSLNHHVPGRRSWGESKPEPLLGISDCRQLTGRRNGCSSQAGEILEIPSRWVNSSPHRYFRTRFPSFLNMKTWKDEYSWSSAISVSVEIETS